MTLTATVRTQASRAVSAPRSLFRVGAWLIVATVSAGVSVAVVAATDAGDTSGSTGVRLMVGLFLLAVAAAWGITSRPTPGRAIDVRSVYLLYGAIGFGLLALIRTDNEVGTAQRVPQRAVPLAMLVTSVAVLAWAIGYAVLQSEATRRFALRARRFAAPGNAWAPRFPSVAVVLYAIGFGARMLQIRGGSYAYLADPRSLITSPSSVGQLLAILERLTLISITVASVNLIRGSRQSFWPRVMLALLLVLEVSSGAYGGTKSALVFILIAVAVPFLATKRRPTLVAVAVALLLISIATSFVGAYRSKVAAGSTRLSGAPAREALVDTAGEMLVVTNLGATLATGAEGLMNRLRQIDNVAIVVERTPSEIPYRSATELVTAPAVSFVPRAVWPGKPVRTTGLDFSRQYYDLPADMYTASAVTVSGDLYRHGGMVVVVVGMMLLGAAARVVDRFWHPRQDLRLSILFTAAFVELINLETDVASLVTGLVVAVAVSLLVTKAAFVSLGAGPET